MRMLRPSAMTCLSDTDRGEAVVVFGYGAQGRSQAQNLRDSGWNVSAYLRPESPRLAAAKADGIATVTDITEAARRADIAAIMLPDAGQPAFYNEYLRPRLKANSALVFAHGLSIHYKQIVSRPDLDVLLVAPLGHGDAVRSNYEGGRGVPCVIAVAQDATGNARRRAEDYAKAIGRRGPFINSTFAEEVETDLFVEQVLLCGGLPELIRSTFETMVAAGYNEDISYFSCIRELAPIVNLIDSLGIAGMRGRISDTARFGALTRGTLAIDAHTRARLGEILGDIRSGKFFGEFLDDVSRGNKTARELQSRDERHPIETIHRKHSGGV